MCIKRIVIILGVFCFLTACEDADFASSTSDSIVASESATSDDVSVDGDTDEIIEDIVDTVESDVNSCDGSKVEMTEEDSYERIVGHLTKVLQNLEAVDSSGFDDEKIDHLSEKTASIEELLDFIVAEGSLTDEVIAKMDEMRQAAGPKKRRPGKRKMRLNQSCEQGFQKHKKREKSICSRIEKDIESGRELPEKVLEMFEGKCEI